MQYDDARSSLVAAYGFDQFVEFVAEEAQDVVAVVGEEISLQVFTLSLSAGLFGG